MAQLTFINEPFCYMNENFVDVIHWKLFPFKNYNAF